MPFGNLPFTSKEELLDTLKDSYGLQKEKAEKLVQVLQEEAESDEGNAKKLWEAIKNGADSVLTDIGLETVSWVENPSQDSMFVMMKDSDNRIKKTTGIYKEPEENWETVYGPVMRPSDVDKDGDVAAATDIKKAAHEFMAEGRVKQFDQDHDLNTGKGTLVESWILKEDKEYELPDGSTEKIEKGSWMVGVQPTDDVRNRIENGEITGWSIFGQADQLELETGKNFNNKTVVNSSKEDTMSENPDTPEKDDGESEVSLKQVQESLKSLEESFNEYKEAPEPSTVKSMEELRNHVKSDENEGSVLVELGKDFELETTEKEEEFDDLAELLDYLENDLAESNFSMLVDAVRGDEVEEESDEEEEDEEEKQAKAKGADVESVREDQVKSKNNEGGGKIAPYANRIKTGEA